MISEGILKTLQVCLFAAVLTSIWSLGGWWVLEQGYSFLGASKSGVAAGVSMGVLSIMCGIIFGIRHGSDVPSNCSPPE